MITLPVTAALLLLMQAGLALVATGLCRARNAGQIVTANLLIMAASVLSFWVCGFGWMFHGDPTRHFLEAAGVMAIGAVIPAGAMAERWTLRNAVLYGFWAGAVPFALCGRWVWGGGWLAGLGNSLRLGHGMVDYAGAGVIHLTAGGAALAGAWLLGPRAGKYGRDGRPKPMPGHNLVFVCVGTLILLAGWLGFTSAPPGSGDHLDVLAANTLLAGAAGAIAAYATTVLKFGKPDPSMICNGALAGLAAISASCAFVNGTAAILTGLAAGFFAVQAVLLFEGVFKLDDPVGAISVHGVGGAWGLLSLGLFANGSLGGEMNGVVPDAGVSGALGKMFGGSANDWGQLGAQAIGAVVCALLAFALTALWLKLSNLITPLRVRRDVELSGLDLAETGAECYPDFHLSDKGSPQV